MKIKNLLVDRGVLSGSIGSLAVKTTSLFLALAVSVLLASLMGPKNFGVYIVVFSTVMLLSIPLTMGLPILMVRYIPQYEAESNFSAIKGLVFRAHQFVFVAYAFFVVGGILFYFVFKSHFSDEFWSSFVWAGALLLFVGLNAVRCALLEGFRYVVIGQMPDLILRNLMIIILVGGASFYHNITPSNAMFLHLIAAITAWAFGLILAKKKLGRELKDYSPEFHTKIWLRQGLAFSFNSGINDIKTKISIYTLAVLQGAEAVGVFEVAVKAATFVSFSLTAINKALAPHISRAYSLSEKAYLQNMIQKASRFMFLMALPVVLIFIIWGKDFISILYGKEYILAFVPLVIISLGQLVNSFSGPVGLFLIMANKQRFVLQVNIANVLLNVVLAFLLTKFFAINGAAIAFALLLVIQNIVFVFYVKKVFGINSTAL